MPLDAAQGLPEGGKARRVYLLLRDDIARGVFDDGTTLPGEQRLAEQFEVSRVTIRRALEALARDGLIERRVGSGTIARPGQTGVRPLVGDFATLMPQVAQMGEATDARLLAFAYGPPTTPVARALGLDAGDRVQTAVRVRLLKGRPFSHLTTHVPEAIAQNYSEADLATTPLFRLLERSGVSIAGADQTVSASLAPPDVADALDVAVGSALLLIERVVRDTDGHGVEHLTALYRPDLFHLSMSLHRVGGREDRHWEPVIGTAGGAGQ